MRPLRKEILVLLASTKDAAFIMPDHLNSFNGRFVLLLEHAHLMDRQSSHIKRETFCSDLNSFT